MTAVDVTAQKLSHRPGKMLQIARHRVVRWFRVPEAELRRQRLQGLQPHPLPRVSTSEITSGKEGPREHVA